jgi:hypothetical protein
MMFLKCNIRQSWFLYIQNVMRQQSLLVMHGDCFM